MEIMNQEKSMNFGETEFGLRKLFMVQSQPSALLCLGLTFLSLKWRAHTNDSLGIDQLLRKQCLFHLCTEQTQEKIRKRHIKSSLSIYGLSLCGATYPCAQGISHLFKAHCVSTDHNSTKLEASRRELRSLRSLVFNKRLSMSFCIFEL